MIKYLGIVEVRRSKAQVNSLVLSEVVLLLSSVVNGCVQVKPAEVETGAAPIFFGLRIGGGGRDFDQSEGEEECRLPEGL